MIPGYSSYDRGGKRQTRACVENLRQSKVHCLEWPKDYVELSVLPQPRKDSRHRREIGQIGIVKASYEFDWTENAVENKSVKIYP